MPDPATGQVGFFGVLKEFDRPVLLALWLRVQNVRIVVAEHVVAGSLMEIGLKILSRPRAAVSADAFGISRPRFISVSIGPGMTAWTVAPWSARNARNDCVMLNAAAFDTE